MTEQKTYVEIDVGTKISNYRSLFSNLNFSSHILYQEPKHMRNLDLNILYVPKKHYNLEPFIHAKDE